LPQRLCPSGIGCDRSKARFSAAFTRLCFLTSCSIACFWRYARLAAIWHALHED
jgi:hypothetical protein